MKKEVIKCDKITKFYGKDENRIQILKGLSFSINKGEFVAIIGPSGSGKSTIMNILGCLDTPTSGKYVLDGEDISKLNDKKLSDIRKNKIGFVFQSFNLLPRTTVLRNVYLPLIYNENFPINKREEKAKDCLSKAGFDMSKVLNKTNQISGGQMQRVAIARSLVNDPSILLADEPTGNLDSKTGEIVLNTFKKLNKENGVTIILITHDPKVASNADRIIQIKDGEIVQDCINKNNECDLKHDK